MALFKGETCIGHLTIDAISGDDTFTPCLGRALWHAEYVRRGPPRT